MNKKYINTLQNRNAFRIVLQSKVVLKKGRQSGGIVAYGAIDYAQMRIGTPILLLNDIFIRFRRDRIYFGLDFKQGLHG